MPSLLTFTTDHMGPYYPWQSMMASARHSAQVRDGT